MKENLLILCPNCHEFVEIEKSDDNIKVKNPCVCLAEGEMSFINWTALILGRWEELEILKIPENKTLEAE